MPLTSLTPAPQLLRRRILLFDPDPAFCRQVAAVFEPRGFEVATADADDAVAIARDFKPDVVLAAVDASDRSGFALCNRLRRAPTLSIPVILLTREISQGLLASHRQLRSRADAYLDKTTTSSRELIAAVEGIVEPNALHRAGDVIELFGPQEGAADEAAEVDTYVEVVPDPAEAAAQVAAPDAEEPLLESLLEAPAAADAAEPAPVDPGSHESAADSALEVALADGDEELERLCTEPDSAHAVDAEAALARGGELNALRQQVSNLQQRRDELRGSMMYERRQREMLEHQLAELTDTAADLHGEVESLNAQLESARNNVAVLEQELREAIAAIEQFHIEDAELREQLDIARETAEVESRAAAAATQEAGEIRDLMRSEHAEELARLQRDQQQAVEELLAEHAEQLAELCADRDEQLAELCAERDGQLAELRAEREAEVAELCADRDEQLAELCAERDGQLAELRAEREAEVAELCAERDEQLAELRSAHTAELAQVQDRLTAKLERMRAKHASTRDDLREQLAEERTARATEREALERELSEVRSRAAHQLAELERDHAVAVEQLEAEWERRLDAADRRGATALATQYLVFTRSLRE